MLYISSSTTWSDLKLPTDSKQTIAFESAPSIKWTSKISQFFTGITPVTEKMYTLVKARIQDHIIEKSGKGPHDLDEQLIDCVARHLLVECGVRFSELNQTDAIAKIFSKIDQNIIECYDGPLAKSSAKVPTDKSMKSQAMWLVAYLMGSPFDIKMVSWDLIKAIFFCEDKEFKKVFKETLVEVAQDLCNALNTNEISENQKRIYEILIGNILALIPFSEPEPDSDLRIPHKIDGKWRLVDYKVEVLALNPEWLGGSMPALGLTPKEKAPQEAKRVLLYRGTPQPTAQGFVCALFADAMPGHSVGEFIYKHFSKECIANWINKPGPWPEKVQIFGQSLGGALAWQTQQHHPEKVDEVNIYGSPTPLSWNSNSSTKPSVQINAFVNDGDPVPYAGMGAEPHWNLYKLFVPAARPFLLAHAALYAAFSKVIVVKVDPNVDGQSTIRKVMNVVHHLLCLILLPVLVTVIALTALKILIVAASTMVIRRVTRQPVA